MTESEREKILVFLLKRVTIDKLHGPRTESLFLSGYFDSLTFVQLIAFLEKKFKVKLTPVMSDFDTLDLIVKQIEKQKEKQDGNDTR